MSLIKVLIADDSAFLRKSIERILSEEKSIKIVDTAVNGREAIEKVNEYHPDVLILDLLMPEMDGLEAFKVIMNDYPVPTIILSAVNPQNMDASVQALLMGAFDYIIKPGGIGAKELPLFREELRSKVLLASQSQIKKVYSRSRDSSTLTLRQRAVDETFKFGVYLRELKPIEEKEAIIDEKAVKKPKTKEKKDVEVKEIEIAKKINKADKKLESKVKKKSIDTISQVPIYDGPKLDSPIIVIGTSVGGPKTLRTILKDLPKKISAPILIVQHLSAFFLDSLAKSLDSACQITVKIATDGEYLRPGVAYIAPGEKHMEITSRNNAPCIRIYKGEPVNFCMPSVDVLFFSAAKVYRSNTIGIILTGMGKDGVAGLGAIKKARGKTIAESEETCVLYGMPKFAKEKGVATMILADYKISEFIRNIT